MVIWNYILIGEINNIFKNNYNIYTFVVVGFIGGNGACGICG